MSLFNLYNEIEKEYENLIPLKQEGLVLFHLYQRQKDGNIGKEFSEEEIIKSLREIRYDLKTYQKECFIYIRGKRMGISGKNSQRKKLSNH